jgi:hypothetical protein
MTKPGVTIGYGAVILEALDEYQAFFIRDDEDTRREATAAMMMAIASGAQPVGALQAVIVEGVLTTNWGLVGAAALALTGIAKENWFYIKASKEMAGTRTEMFPLKARTVEDARAEIEALPEVRAMKVRLREKMVETKQ